MVKSKRSFLLIIFLTCFILINSCHIDWLGAFYSSNIDERLAERDNFHFLTPADFMLTLGSDYQFLVITDTHIEDGDTFGLEGIIGLIEADKANEDKIRFAVFLGDITQFGGDKDIGVFIDNITEPIRNLGVPCYPVIGNHDFYFSSWPSWRDKIGSTMYKVNSDTTTLFILDSGNAFFGKDQLDWLERELEKTTSDRVFVFTHNSLFINGPVDMQQVTDTRERARIVSILRNRCDIMFMGHSHKRFYSEVGNVKYVSFEDFHSTKIYCLVTVTPSGVSYEFNKL